jgi:F-type H+-transporting ATPase subunit epsilon
MNLEVHILTPHQTLFQGKAEMVIAPGENGDFGVLPYHASMIIHLKTGTISVHQGNQHITPFLIKKGWANIVNNHCFFLVEQ